MKKMMIKMKKIVLINIINIFNFGFYLNFNIKLSYYY